MAFTYKVKQVIKSCEDKLRRILNKSLFLKEIVGQKNPFHNSGISSLFLIYGISPFSFFDVSANVLGLKLLQDLKAYYHSLVRFCGELPRLSLNTFRSLFQRLSDVLEHSPVCLYLGDWENKLKHIRVTFLHLLSTFYVQNPLIGYDYLKKLCFSTSILYYRKMNKILHSFLCTVAQRTPNHTGYKFLIA